MVTLGVGGNIGFRSMAGHIQTTHIGSLPRPHKLLDILKAKYGRQPYDQAELNSTLAQAVVDCVRKQVECGRGIGG